MSTEAPGAPAPAAPATVAEAELQMDTLKADEAFMKRVGAGDPAAFDQYSKAWRVSRGLPPTPAAPVNAQDVFAHMDERVRVQAEQHAASLVGAGLSEEGAYQITNLRPIPLKEKQWHEQQLAAKMKDQNWVSRYLSGDVDCRREMAQHCAGKTMPVGSLAQIHEWERLHNRSLSK
jgi:hypothetical protein